jgi:hypothetical protein
LKIIYNLLKLLNIKKEYNLVYIPPYNERHEKIIEWIDWSLEKYKEDINIEKKNQQNEETIIIDNIIEYWTKKRYSYNQKEKSFTK